MKKALFLVMCLLISAFGISASAADKPADFV